MEKLLYHAEVRRNVTNPDTEQERTIKGFFSVFGTGQAEAELEADKIMAGPDDHFAPLQTTDERIEWDSERDDDEDFVDYSFELVRVIPVA